MQGTKVLLKILVVMICVFLSDTGTAANTNNTGLNETSLSETDHDQTTSAEKRIAEGAAQTSASTEKIVDPQVSGEQVPAEPASNEPASNEADVEALQFELAQLSEAQVREVMLQGAKAAIENYGGENTLYNDPAVTVPMPKKIRRTLKVVRKLGGKKIERKFTHALNKTVEHTLKESSPLILEYISSIPIDNNTVFTEGSNAAISEYFSQHAQTELLVKILDTYNKVSETHELVSSLHSLLKKARLIKKFYAIKKELDTFAIELLIAVLANGIKVTH